MGGYDTCNLGYEMKNVCYTVFEETNDYLKLCIWEKVQMGWPEV